ncbi:MAG: patatin-like phospholipase family protein [Candidatus Omnitrophica bacterium]|nr:patatin-like phospholipase family protein [Candidatus Omnitrophota bacterium]
MDSKEISLIISNSPPFNGLSSRQINKLINISEVKEYKNGEIIYKEGDPPSHLYFLIKGRVVASAKSGKEDRRIEVLKRGTCFGIISLLTDDPHSVTVKSIEISLILQVEYETFKMFLKKNPYLALDFSRILSQRVKVRSKPKKIFQSKKIGIMGSILAGKTRYMFDLGVKVKEQTQKDVICIQIITFGEEKAHFIPEVLSQNRKSEILSLKDFSEEALTDHIINSDIDYLCIRADVGDNFLPLLNFLSESYHFILYEIPHKFLEGRCDDFIIPAHQVHFILFPKREELTKGASLIRELKVHNPLNQEKIKVIFAESFAEKGLPLERKRRLINHPVYASLPSASHESYHKALRRISREIGEVTLGLALGSGAAYGFSHIGVLKVLEENKIDIDIICGSSMGAVIAALWAVGHSIEEIEKLSNESGKKIGKFSILGFTFPLKGIMRARRLESIFKGLFKNLTFYDLKHTLKVVAFDFLKRKPIVLSKGLLYKAVAASCAFPGIFEPINFKSNILLDGGILSPLPTKVLLNYDVHKIIASNISLSSEQSRREYRKRDRFHIFDFIFGSIETMQQMFVEEAVKIADVVIHTNLEGLGWMEFEKISAFIRRGEIAAQEKIEEIKNLASF